MKIQIAAIFLSAAALASANQESLPTMEATHEQAIAWFIGRPGFGLSRMLPTKDIRLGKKPLSNEAVSLYGTSYRIRDIQLIGILEHNPPVAYLIDDGTSASPHPSTENSSETSPMKVLKDYKVRSVNDDEERALSTMKSDKNRNIVIAGSTLSSMEVVAAIRATTSCIKCHDVQKDDLLGAFSYSLDNSPIPAIPAQQGAASLKPATAGSK